MIQSSRWNTGSESRQVLRPREVSELVDKDLECRLVGLRRLRSRSLDCEEFESEPDAESESLPELESEFDEESELEDDDALTFVLE
jgi:hypothetical protein